MTCTSCSSTVESALEKVQGVKKAVVALATEEDRETDFFFADYRHQGFVHTERYKVLRIVFSWHPVLQFRLSFFRNRNKLTSQVVFEKLRLSDDHYR